MGSVVGAARLGRAKKASRGQRRTVEETEREPNSGEAARNRPVSGEYVNP
jgi:hypothetical protein